MRHVLAVRLAFQRMTAVKRNQVKLAVSEVETRAAQPENRYVGLAVVADDNAAGDYVLSGKDSVKQLDAQVQAFVLECDDEGLSFLAGISVDGRQPRQ